MRLSIGLIIVLVLGGCAEESDWRLGEESLAECIDRLDRGPEFRDPLLNDEGTWVPTFVFDVTNLGEDAWAELIAPSSEVAQGTQGSMVTSGDETAAREAFMNAPATESGAVFFGEGPDLYKVRGEPASYRMIVNQGCQLQQTNMRLLSWGATREEALLDGEIPEPQISQSQLIDAVEEATD